MKTQLVALLCLTLLFNQTTFAEIEERNVDFVVSPTVLNDGEIQVAFEWVSQTNFRKKDLSLMDIPKIADLHPTNNQLIVSKIAFLAKKPFANLSQSIMNTQNYISSMLSSVSVSQKSADKWYVTNTVKAYSIPFKVSFDFLLKETNPATLGPQLTNYLRDEASAIAGTGKERFMVLDMTNFSQLMYRNYSIIYMKEISSNETLIVSGIIAGFDIKTANSFFNYPPFSSTQSTMVGNLRTQIINMANKIKR